MGSRAGSKSAESSAPLVPQGRVGDERMEERIDLALSALHEPLACDDGETPVYSVAPTLLVKDVHVGVIIETPSVELVFSRLFCCERPPDATQWLVATQSMSDGGVGKAREDLLKVLRKAVRKYGCGRHGPGVFGMLEDLLAHETKGAMVRAAAAGVLRALVKRTFRSFKSPTSSLVGVNCFRRKRQRLTSITPSPCRAVAVRRR